MCKNKPERVQDIIEVIDSVLDSGICPFPLAAEIAGKMQFASNQFYGRIACGMISTLQAHRYRSTSQFCSEATLEALRDMKDVLKETVPRTLDMKGERSPILVFTDAAAEGVNFSEVSIGAVIIDLTNNVKEMWGCNVPEDLVHEWQKEGGWHSQTIGQAELLPVAMVRQAWSKQFSTEEYFTSSTTIVLECLFVEGQAAVNAAAG
jgi:hypothetical protein